MDREYRLDREYSVKEIIRYNLRMWWLAAILAVVCGFLLGAYKFVANYDLTERKLYQEVHQITASLYVNNYNEESAIERGGTIMKIVSSYRTYERLIENTGYFLTYEGYVLMVDTAQTEVSDVVSLYVNFPVEKDGFYLQDEGSAKIFMNDVITAVDEMAQEILGVDAVEVMDAPYLSSRIEQIEVYAISSEDFWRDVFKGATAGVLLGIIVEVVCYSFWMLLCKRPKNVEEIRQCLEVPVIDTLRERMDNEEAFQRIALFLKKDQERACLRVNCINMQSPKRDTASKLAMAYASSQHRTLFIDLASGESGGMGENSISRYLLDEADAPKPMALNQYLDMVCRSVADEDGRNIVMSERFEEYVREKSEEYEYIVINSADVVKSADAYAASKLCDRNFIICGRKTVRNETMYRVKNMIDVNDISVDGVLVYEL